MSSYTEATRVHADAFLDLVRRRRMACQTLRSDCIVENGIEERRWLEEEEGKVMTVHRFNGAYRRAPRSLLHASVCHFE